MMEVTPDERRKLSMKDLNVVMRPGPGPAWRPETHYIKGKDGRWEITEIDGVPMVWNFDMSKAPKDIKSTCAVAYITPDGKKHIAARWWNNETGNWACIDPMAKVIAFFPIPPFPEIPESDDFHDMQDQEWTP